MFNSEFSPFGVASIKLKFKCKNCNSIVESGSISVPMPNFMAEKSSDSYSDTWDSVLCECGKEYEVSVYTSFSGGSIEIEDLDEDDEVEIIEEYEELDDYYEEQIDSIFATKDYYNLFLNEIKNLKRLNEIDIDDLELQVTLQRQIFSGAITCLEDYLSSTLIREVIQNNNNFKNFVRTFHDIRNEKFILSEIFEKYEQLKDTVKRKLLDIIYHDLPKVKGMYEDSLKINFPGIENLMKDIKSRHDMVHRNGKNKEGETIDISKEVVDALIKRVEKFVEEIDKEIRVKYEVSYD